MEVISDAGPLLANKNFQFFFRQLARKIKACILIFESVGSTNL
jgi:hypothetical protein